MKQYLKILMLITYLCSSQIAIADKWYSAQPMLVPRGGAAAVAYGNYIYVFGGKTINNNVLNSVERYDLSTFQWDTTVVPVFQYPRYNATAVVFENKIYLMGGQNGDYAIREVEVYDPVQNQWTEVQNLRREREALAGAVFNNRIYAIGGQKDDHTLIDEIEWYDYPSDDWLDAIFDLPYPRAAHFYGVAANKFYMFGGYYYGPTKTAYKAIPDADGYQWVQIGDLGQSRTYGAATKVRNEIFLIGGELNTGKTAMVEVFNTDSETYGPCEPISSPRSGIAAVTVHDTIIYVIGGFETNYDDPVATVEYYYGKLITAIDNQPITSIPANHILIKGFPNPFNNAIRLDITIPEKGEYKISIYDITGQKVTTFYTGILSKGDHSFNWRVNPDLSSGLYMMIISSNKYFQNYKMIYVK